MVIYFGESIPCWFSGHRGGAERPCARFLCTCQRRDSEGLIRRGAGSTLMDLGLVGYF